MAVATVQRCEHSGGWPRGSRRQQSLSTVVAAIAMVVAGCADDPQKPVVPCTADHPCEIPPPGDPPCVNWPCDAAAVIARLGDAYRRRDYAHSPWLLHDDFVFILHPDPTAYPPPPEAWGRTEELRIHKRMFEPQSIPPREEPVPAQLWLRSVNINLTSSQAFAERPEYYRSEANPNGLDPVRWKAWGADFDTSVLLDTEGDIDYQVEGRASFVVAQDLTKAAGWPGAYSVYRWQDLGDRTPGVAVSGKAWSAIKRLYRPSRCGEPCDPEGAVQALVETYRKRDYAPYSKLFHDDFLFVLHPDPTANPPLPEHWDQAEELLIHRRMFDPQNIPPTDPPLDPRLWLAWVFINLTAAQPFAERPEFYRSASNPEGLDPTRWKAWGTDYDTFVYFDTRGEIDYKIHGRAWFVVVQDLAKPFGEPGRFTLLRWQDLGNRLPLTTSVQPRTWGLVKNLYRP